MERQVNVLPSVRFFNRTAAPETIRLMCRLASERRKRDEDADETNVRIASR